jgi:hypothetical protein
VEGRVVRAVVSRYGTPPFAVSHGGGVFTTRLVERGSTDDRALQSLSAAVLSAFGLHEGVSHTEYIRAVDGTWYFLETSARVGGAHIADLVEVATGANFWAEWAKIEAAAARGASYAPPADRGDYAGLIVSLARQEQRTRPHTSMPRSYGGSRSATTSASSSARATSVAWRNCSTATPHDSPRISSPPSG